MKNAQTKGLQIATSVGHLRKESESHYEVRSLHSPVWYNVRWQSGRWKCDCSSVSTRELCEHIAAVTTFQSLPFTIMATLNYDLLTCPWCGSDPQNHSSVGSRQRKFGKTNRLKCSKCGHTFSDRYTFTKMRTDPMLVTASIDLYTAGLSTRQIALHLQNVYGMEISHMGVWRWLKKYIRVMEEFVRRLKPRVGAEWHLDEMIVPSKGGGYLWNAMDRKSRFLLASVLMSGRSEDEAFSVLSQAIAQAKRIPGVAVTDGLKSYDGAIARHGIRRHISSPRFVDPKNNNVIENLNGQLRSRYNLTRGFGTPEKAGELAAALEIRYNFVQPKSSLGGRTPAQAAGLRLKGRNPWLALARGAVSERVSASTSNPSQRVRDS